MKWTLRDFFLLIFVVAIHLALRNQLTSIGAAYFVPPVVCLSACCAWNAFRTERSELIPSIVVGSVTSFVSCLVLLMEVTRYLEAIDYWSWAEDWLIAIVLLAEYLVIGAVIGGVVNLLLAAILPQPSK